MELQHGWVPMYVCLYMCLYIFLSPLINMISAGRVSYTQAHKHIRETYLLHLRTIWCTCNISNCATFRWNAVNYTRTNYNPVNETSTYASLVADPPASGANKAMIKIHFRCWKIYSSVGSAGGSKGTEDDRSLLKLCPSHYRFGLVVMR